MPDSVHRGSHRVLGHLARQKMTYVVAALALYISPVPAMAADLVGTSDLKNGAVTTPKLADNSVTDAKIRNLKWHPFELMNGWVDYNEGQRAPAWALDAEGVVHLRGAISGGDTTAFARLPAAVRPSAYVWVSTTLVNSKPGRIVIDPTGYVQADYEDVFTDVSEFTSLDGVTWAK